MLGSKRVALFGHRAVGKTTLLAMFYREASHGRVPGVRLAAADPATADYLADKIAQLESGEPIPGTLSELPLRLRLYRGLARLDLVLYDYQGEDTELGSNASIHDYFADCDAILLCLDGEATQRPADRRRRQLEIEQLLERWLAESPEGMTERPLALVVTKYDRVIAQGGPAPGEVDRLVDERFGMTRHALAGHVPRSALFGVSSYGPWAGEDGRPPADLAPEGLEAPLEWLARELEDLDIARWNWLADLAPGEHRRLARCLAALERRYPRSPRILEARRRLRKLRGRSRGRSFLVALGGLAAVAVAVAGYDAWGIEAARRFESSGASPASIEHRWSQLLAAHPTLDIVRPADARFARERLAHWKLRAAEVRLASGTVDPTIDDSIRSIREAMPALKPEIDRVERVKEQALQESRWNEVYIADLAAVENPEAHLALVRAYLREFPGTPHANQAVELVEKLEAAVAKRQAQSDREEIDGLLRAAEASSMPPSDVLTRADEFLTRRPASPYKTEVEDFRLALLERIDHTAFEKAQVFSREQPLNFAARRKRYQDYLDTHAAGGRHVSEAVAAIERIDHERSSHLYRQAFDHEREHPEDVPAVAERLRNYLEIDPDGRFAPEARAYLAWWERISAPGEYTVTLRRASLDRSITKPLAGSGPNLSVELWVAGVKHGPTPIVTDSSTPVWDYTLPRKVRWMYGDPVVIRIIDNDWGKSYVQTFHARENDRLAMRLLSGTVHAAKGGENSITFSSDFVIPTLPAPQD
jgi:hypothetical protein